MNSLQNYLEKWRDKLNLNLNKNLSEKLLLDRNQYENLAILLGKLHVERIKNLKKINSLDEVEFKVFSQFGNDGIIQYLIDRIKIPNKIFIEFGASNYLESNTRFLLQNDNWQGLIIDGSNDYIEFIKKDRIYYRHNLTAIAEFITKDNINKIIKSNIQIKDIGLLSIDIDGNDYWVWKEINAIYPIIVICEYNSLLGSEKAVVVPYKADFSILEAHYSCSYYGASLKALVNLATDKGYDFIGCDSEGVDAFFVRKDYSKFFKKFDAKSGFVQGKYRISRDSSGQFNYLSRDKAIQAMAHLKIYDILSQEMIKIKDLNLK
ncbi:MAG: hypothetical protein M1429_03750 [Patescibacteria group bacterium]|nr:hypothetical protein [Patescibacteria group bacterium]